MSGILSAIQAVGQMFGGYGLVTLGPVQFQGLEVPEKLPLGGKQAMAVFTMPGGQRIIQAMGRDDDPIAWTGYLSGASAESRMQLLDSIRQSGQEIQLAFGQSSFQVVVSSFTASYERQNWIPYSIMVTVLQDNAAQFAQAQPSLLDSINGDLNNSLGFDVAASAETLIGNAQTAVNVAGALGLNSGAWTGAISSLNAAQTSLISLQNTSSGSLASVASAAETTGNILGVSQISTAASALNAALGNAQTMANATQALGYVSRSMVNLSKASA
ncbi:MAG: hypothetical protein KGI54_16165 [Pseudomonadota bacterium]|nr:hypothetical protein [Pseudomonadota bacterium]